MIILKTRLCIFKYEEQSIKSNEDGVKYNLHIFLNRKYIHLCPHHPSFQTQTDIFVKNDSIFIMIDCVLELSGLKSFFALVDLCDYCNIR